MNDKIPDEQALSERMPTALEHITEHLVADDVFASKYRVEGTLGEGGMGVVLAAHHIRLDEPAAIKVLRPGTMQTPRMIDRFLREARSAAKIKNQHIARVLDVDVIPSSGAPYIVMERLVGTDLNKICNQGDPVSVSDAIAWILQACETIGEAHALGIIHRDLKPGNLFLARLPDGSTCIKVLDFGLAKMILESTLTENNDMFGTTKYMSPEQMLSTKNVDRRTDIWALGVILYRLITGSTPFPGEEPVEIITRVLSKTPPQRPSDLRPDIPPGLDAVILRCLEWERERRFLTVAELVAALQPFAASAAGVDTPAIGLQSTVDDPSSDAPAPIGSTVDDPSFDEYPSPRVASMAWLPGKKDPGAAAILLIGLIGFMGLGALCLDASGLFLP